MVVHVIWVAYTMFAIPVKQQLHYSVILLLQNLLFTVLSYAMKLFLRMPYYFSAYTVCIRKKQHIVWLLLQCG